MYDGDYAEDLGMGYPELVELARGRANDPFTEIWVVIPWDVDTDAFHEVVECHRGALLYDGYVDTFLTTFVVLWFAIIVATQSAMEGTRA